MVRRGECNDHQQQPTGGGGIIPEKRSIACVDAPSLLRFGKGTLWCAYEKGFEARRDQSIVALVDDVSHLNVSTDSGMLTRNIVWVFQSSGGHVWSPCKCLPRHNCWIREDCILLCSRDPTEPVWYWQHWLWLYLKKLWTVSWFWMQCDRSTPPRPSTNKVCAWCSHCVKIWRVITTKLPVLIPWQTAERVWVFGLNEFCRVV